MDGSFRIRAMRIGEFNKVARLVYDSVHTLCRGEYTERELEAWVPSNMYMPAFRRSLYRCYAIVAVDENGEIAGFMSTERDGYINRLYTSPDHIMKGVASALLESTEIWARAHNIRFLELEASKSAEGFYIKKGFKKIGTVKSVKNNLEFISAKMRKELKNNG